MAQQKTSQHLMQLSEKKLERRIARLEEDLAGAAPLEEVSNGVVGSVSWIALSWILAAPKKGVESLNP